MSKKKVLKIRPVLMLLNIIVILIIISFYGIRMYKFYKKENEVIQNKGDTTFLTILTNKQSLVDNSNGLVYDESDSTYTYKGKVEDNYLYYSGIMFRITGIDKYNNIKLVSDKSLTLMYYSFDNEYTNSSIYKWLNSTEEEHTGIFENILVDKDSFITNYISCMDVISDVSNATCENEVNEYKFSILSLYDYVKAGSQNSYLNNGENYYLNTFNELNQNYYVNSLGEVGVNSVSTKVLGVRPTLTIKSNIKLLKGIGTQNNPYIIEGNNVNEVKDVYIGSIINYSNMLWKVVDKEDGKIKLALNDVIKDNDKLVSKTFGGTSNIYSKNKNTVGAYLNDTFYNKLDNKGYLVSGDWYVGLNSLNKLSYLEKYTKKVNLNVGMISLGDMFVGDIGNTLTITPGIESSSIIMVISSANNVFGDFIATEYNIRPSIFIKDDLLITSGNGTMNSPYELGVKEDEINE